MGVMNNSGLGRVCQQMSWGVMGHNNEARWTTADKDKNQAYLPLARKWKYDEHIAQPTQVMSDSLLIWIQHAGMVEDMWKTTVSEFNHKG